MICNINPKSVSPLIRTRETAYCPLFRFYLGLAQKGGGTTPKDLRMSMDEIMNCYRVCSVHAFMCHYGILEVLKWRVRTLVIGPCLFVTWAGVAVRSVGVIVVGHVLISARGGIRWSEDDIHRPIVLGFTTSVSSDWLHPTSNIQSC